MEYNGKGPPHIYMKKVTSIKLTEIEICCNLDGVDQKFPRTKSLEVKSIKDNDLKWVVLKFKKRLFLNT